MKFLRLVKRYIEIDVNYLFAGRFKIVKLFSIISVNASAILSIFKINTHAYISKAKIISDKPLTIKTFLAGIYDFWFETRETNIFSNNKPLIVDVGANVGQFAVACKTILPHSIVHSFEPDPATFNLLKNNTANYKNVYVNNLALSEKVGKLKFYKNLSSSEWSSLVKPYSGKTETISVNSMKLDDYIANKSIKKIDLLKIDVEGAELLVLHGGKKALKNTKFIIIELSIDRSEEGMRSSNILSFLIDNNFEVDSIGRIFRERVGATQSSANIVFRNRFIK